MKKFRKWLALFVMSAGILSALPMSASAFANEEAQAEQEEAVPESQPSVPEQEKVPEKIPEKIPIEEKIPETDGTSFSIPGNGQLVDDLKEDSTKQFLTIQTKKGNTFFLVLDRSSNTENVYMLSMVDENDLAEFIENKSETQKKPEAEKPQVVIPEPEAKPEEPEPRPEPKNGGMNTGMLIAAVVFLAGGIGAYYVKVVKPKKAEENADDEDLEFYDGGAYINEDQADGPESEKEE